MVAFIAQERIPFAESLDRIYEPSKLAFQEQRYARIKQIFTEKYGIEPELFIRSPGRVNLIGEHIDYSGFSVLPMALDKDVVIAVAKISNQGKALIKVASTKPEKYSEFSFEHGKDSPISIDSSVLFWGNYFMGPYKAFFESFNREPVSFCALVDGTVPAGAGVSSSSAFSCAATLSTAVMNNVELEKGILASIAIHGERYTGVIGGGMDQSISVMGVSNSALMIHFQPKFYAECIPIPGAGIEFEDYVFVVANTPVVADKHETAPRNYNLRVVETRLGAAILAKYLGLADKESLWNYKGILDAFAPNSTNSVRSLELLLVEAINCFKPSKYSFEQVAERLQISVEQLKSKYIGSIKIECDGFQLFNRCKHVLTEAKRVFEFQNVTLGLEPFSGNVLNDLGKLMNESQTSCRELFECSCPEIDQLQKICLNAGALGSRLTGAGWGGCTVSLVLESRVEDFIQRIRKDYYEKTALFKDGNFDEAVFYCRPGNGSFTVKY